MMPFGNYLEHLRRSRGLLQKQLAYYIGVNPCYVSSLEKGKKGPPTKKILEKITKVLNLTFQEQQKLWESIELSKLNRKLPTEISSQEYSFIKELWDRLGVKYCVKVHQFYIRIWCKNAPVIFLCSLLNSPTLAEQNLDAMHGNNIKNQKAVP